MLLGHSCCVVQMLDGQAVSDPDRTLAAQYTSKQAEAETSVPAQASSLQAHESHGLPGSLPGSSQPGSKLSKGIVLKRR